jgi:hypothetical protein
MDITKICSEIVQKIDSLRKLLYPDYHWPISYLTIFAQSNTEFSVLRAELAALGAETAANNGYKYTLNTPLEIQGEVIPVIRVRQPDIHRTELGCADLSFDAADYEQLRAFAIQNKLDVIVRDGYEMIELSDFTTNVYAYLLKEL